MTDVSARVLRKSYQPIVPGDAGRTYVALLTSGAMVRGVETLAAPAPSLGDCVDVDGDQAYWVTQDQRRPCPPMAVIRSTWSADDRREARDFTRCLIAAQTANGQPFNPTTGAHYAACQFAAAIGYLARRVETSESARITFYDVTPLGREAVAFTEDAQIATAIAQFPAEFGLRAYPGLRFTISRAASFINDVGEVVLYTEVLRDGRWLAFAKGTVAELRREVVELRREAVK